MANSSKGQLSNNINSFRKRLRDLDISGDGLGEKKFSECLCHQLPHSLFYKAIIVSWERKQGVTKSNNRE